MGFIKKLMNKRFNKEALYHNFLDACEATITVILAVALVLSLVWSIEAVQAQTTPQVDPDVYTEIAVNGSAIVIVGYDSQTAADAAPADVHLDIPFVFRVITQTDLDQLLQDPHVLTIESHKTMDAQLIESVPLVGGQGPGTGGAPGEIIAILDTGVDGTHPMLQNKVVAEACLSYGLGSTVGVCPGGKAFEDGPGTAVPCPQSDCWHGTHVAAIAAGYEPSVRGVAPSADVLAIQVFSQVSGQDKTVALQLNILRALDYVNFKAQTMNIGVVNLSVGDNSSRSDQCADFPGSGSPSIQKSIARLKENGVITVISAGNEGGAGLSWPACTPGAVTVSSTDKQDNVSGFSNTASYLDYFAPGETITSAAQGGGYRTEDGTSQAVPHFTGAYAAVRSYSNGAQVTRLLDALTYTGKPIATSFGDRPRIHVLFSQAAFSGPDTDGDGVGDLVDNCIEVGNAWDIPDASGEFLRDTDGDGYGNICDPDLNNDGGVNVTDLGILRHFIQDPASQTFSGTNREDADLDGDGDVDTADMDIMRPYFYGPPGPAAYPLWP